MTTEDLPKLHVVLASIRPGRVGEPIAHWIVERARARADFDVELVDLKEVNLPLMAEPNHPKLRQYTFEHTKRWSARVHAADAFVFVMPEHNHGYSAPLKNAFDYLTFEWLYKPVGFVSYGGIAGGTRAVQQFKQVVAGLKMTPLMEGVAIPMVQEALDDTGSLPSTPELEQAADAMFAELVKMEAALRPTRGGVRAFLSSPDRTTTPPARRACARLHSDPRSRG